MKVLTIFGILCTLGGVGLAGAASGWLTYGFDGGLFQKGGTDAAIQVRDGYLPVPGAGSPPEDRLPVGSGAVAVLGYLQSSGGKLRGHPCVLPMVGVPVTLTAKHLTVAGRTDANGYLILALPPGSYDAHLLGFLQKVTVGVGKTALVAIRGGKRMVD